MAQRNSVARVYGVMQELQQLRDKVCTLSEKNIELAKALTTTKQELTKARTAQTALFSDKVVEWMEARRKSVEVQHQAIQCSFDELDQDTCASVENGQLEPDPPLSPRRSDGVVQTLYSHLRVSSPIVANAIHERVSTSFKQIKSTDMTALHTQDDESAVESEAAISEDNDETPVRTADSSRSNAIRDAFSMQAKQHLRTFSSNDDSGSERTNSQTRVTRRLRQRDASMSYVEPKLNIKLRRGDYYGLGKRTGQPSKTRRMISEPRRANSAFVPTLFCQHFSPFRRRTMRPVQRVSYAEPKLNTKLRQGDKFTFTT